MYVLTDLSCRIETGLSEIPQEISGCLITLSRSVARWLQRSVYRHIDAHWLMLSYSITAASVALVACCFVAPLCKAEQDTGKRQEIKTISSLRHSSPWFGKAGHRSHFFQGLPVMS